MTRTITPPADPGQRGTAMLLIATLLIALLAGGGVALYLQLQSTKGADMIKSSRTSLYCAEAGLAIARPLIALNYALWPVLLDDRTDNNPSWYPITGSMDEDPENDYEVTIRDNHDEVPPAANDPLRDNDRQAFLVGRCLNNPAVSRQVTELVRASGGGHVYRSQAGGGALNSGNKNTVSPSP